MEIGFPLKGLDTNSPQNTMPEGASADLLNSVPFDRDYIMRGAVRNGTSKFMTTQMGNGGQAVLLEAQVTRALDPLSIQPTTQLLNETFTYANGELNTVAPTFWGVTDGSSTQTGLAVTSNAVRQTTTNRNARYIPALAIGSVYIVKMTVTPTVTPANGQIFSIKFRQNAVGGGSIRGTNLAMSYSTGSGKWTMYFQAEGSATQLGAVQLATGIIAVGTPFVFELRVNGNNCTGYIDGILTILNQVITADSTKVVVGFSSESSSQDTYIFDTFQVYAAAPLASFRQTSLVAVCGGNIYVGDPAVSTTMSVAISGSGVLSDTLKPQMAAMDGLCYFVDSQHNMKVLDLDTDTVADITLTTGSESANTLGANTLIASWRDRLVVAAPPAFPQNFFMSRQGDTSDWDYGQTDEAAAVDGNASRAGAIGEPLNCLMPWTDDVLILGGDHSIYKIEGDLAAGGSILLLSDAVGTLGPDCWDVDPNGIIYFVGSGGLYKMQPGGLPENIGNSAVRNYFASINRVTHYVISTWDRDRNGLHVHITPVNSGSASNMFWDATTGGFFPIQYPVTHGPMTAISFDGDGPTDRQVLLAGRDGYIRKVDPAALTDDGTAITSYVLMGPYRPAGDAALSVLEALEIILGDAPAGFTETDFGLTISIIVAKDAYTALTSPDKTVSFVFTKQARRKRLLQRISGGTFFFKITGTASKLWSLEKLVALFTEGGLQRRY